MRRIFIAFSLVTVAGLSLAGCPDFVLSPPAQFLPLESPRPLNEGRTYLGVEGGVASAVFGPDIPGGSLVVRHGLGDDLELRIDASAGWITDASPSLDFRGIASARVGFKGLVSPNFPHAAWVAGIGGGASAAGGFVSGDAGLVFGYENPYIVPFLRMSLVTSVPIAARQVDITDAGAEEPSPTFDTPHTTFGARLGVGARIPIDPAEITFGLTYLQLVDTRGEDIGIFGLSVGVGTSF